MVELALRRKFDLRGLEAALTLFGGFGAAADAHVGRLEQADPGIEGRLGEAPHVGRGVDPGEGRGVEVVAAAPAFGLDDLEVEVQLQLVGVAGELVSPLPFVVSWP